MIWSHRGVAIPLAKYHGVPEGWSAEEIVRAHERLGAEHTLSILRASEPGAPAWLPERDSWLQYRAALYAIAEGVGSGDEACVELAVRFIELRFIGSYSGYVREKLARRLRRAVLTREQRSRLHDHFSRLLLDGERTKEYGPYFRLWRRIITTEEIEELLKTIEKVRGEEAAQWVSERLR
jgi:hypothetical protein